MAGSVLPGPEERKAMHRVYVAIHGEKDRLPHNPSHRTRLLTEVFGGNRWSWWVVGITPSALNRFAENDFKKTKGIVRAHLKSRREIYDYILNTDLPLNCEQLFSYLLTEEETVLATKRENSPKVDLRGQYIPLSNSDRLLFQGRYVGWHHGADEQEALRSVFPNETAQGMEITRPNEMDEPIK